MIYLALISPANTARNDKSAITTLANHVELLFRLLAQVDYPEGRRGLLIDTAARSPLFSSAAEGKPLTERR